MEKELAVINRYFKAFSEKKPEDMLACYHVQAKFSDEVFLDLNHEGIQKMWTMLLRRGKDLIIESDSPEIKNGLITTKWTANYTFSQTGRMVTNKVTSKFKFKDGLIIEQEDTFDFHKWSKQAFGIMGYFMGGTSWFRDKVREKARKSIDRYVI